MNAIIRFDPANRPRRSRPIRVVPLCAWLLAASSASSLAQEKPENAPVTPRDPAQWIVDYALAYGERIKDAQTEDADYVLIWMEAAGRVSPNLADAHLWRYDPLSRLNRPDDARQALADYCRASPNDLRAAFNLLDLEFAAARTAEERIALCQARADQPDIQPELASAVHRRLAEILIAQGDRDAGLAEARRAVELVELNLPAQQLLAAIEGRLDEPQTRVQLLVIELRGNPASVDARWRMADTLAALGRSADAVRWYALTGEAFTRQFPESALPADLQLAQAVALWEAGDNDAALEACKDVLAADPGNIDAAMLLIAIARDAGKDTNADEQANLLAAHLRELEPKAVEKHDPAVCSAIAAFCLDVQYDPHRALEFARHADTFQPDNPAIRSLLGRALVETGQAADAVTVLLPVAAVDQPAGLALATALRTLTRDDDAIAVLQSAAHLRLAGKTYRKIRAVLRELHADAPEQPDAAPVDAALAQLDPALLEFDANPGASLKYDVRLHHTELPLSAPVRADVSLDNIGNFPITIGDARMVPAQVAVSVAERGKGATARTGYLTVELNDRFVLLPGERTTRTVRLDTATVTATLNRQAQRPIEFEFTFVPAPRITDDAKLVSSLAGVEPITRRITRLAVNATPEGMARLAAQLRTGGEAQRLAAISILMALMQERMNEVRGSRATYPMSHVDEGQCSRLIRMAIRDTSPVVRARAACALSFLVLDDESTAEAAPLLSDAHVLPRLMAMELFAKRQGKVFVPVLKRLTEDPDPLVSRLAVLWSAE